MHHIIDYGVRTRHICTGCLFAVSKKEFRYVREGCVHAIINETNATKFSAWTVDTPDGKVHQWSRCLRCMIRSDMCKALPEEMNRDAVELEDLLEQIFTKTLTEMGANPSYDDESPASLTANPRFVSSTRTLSDLEVREKKQDGADKASGMVKLVERSYIPHASTLWLHSGAVADDEDPRTDIRPVARPRDKRSLTAKVSADARSLEQDVQKRLREEQEETESPRRKIKTGNVSRNLAKERASRMEEIVVELSQLEDQRERASRTEKGACTKKIKKLNDELDRLRK